MKKIASINKNKAALWVKKNIAAGISVLAVLVLMMSILGCAGQRPEAGQPQQPSKEEKIAEETAAEVGTDDQTGANDKTKKTVAEEKGGLEEIKEEEIDEYAGQIEEIGGQDELDETELEIGDLEELVDLSEKIG